MRWEKKLDILGPIEQAERCLALWLKEEKRTLGTKQRQRAAALMARYFHYEDGVTDQLMLSFLRHYSGGNMDLEDPASVRMEIKSVLDQSRALHGRNRGRVVLIGMMIAVLGWGMWDISHRTITKGQQAELKALVREITARDKNATAARLWADMKQPLNVRSYQDIPWWRYWQSRGMLEGRLTNPPVIPATRLRLGEKPESGNQVATPAKAGVWSTTALQSSL